MAQLIVIVGDSRRDITLVPLNTIGRHPDNSIQILDRIVSKEHAQILKAPDGRYLYRDLGSLNGSVVNGNQVSEHWLQDGDEITLGAARLLFVEQTVAKGSLQQVTIAPVTMESHIRQKIDTLSIGEFVPENKLLDVELLRRDYEKLRISHELSRAIMGVFDLDELLPKILDKSFELLSADRGVILLVDSEGNLIPRWAKHRQDRKRNEQIVLSNSILNEVAQQKRAVLSSDATMDSRFSGAHSIIIQGIRSTMCVPLLYGTEMLGIMHLDSQIATNAFTDKDLQLFTSIANQAAMAIQNARLAKKIEEETRTRAQFQRLLSPNLVEQLVKGDLTLEKGGEQREVTILISDIRGFTAMSEQKQPSEIVSMLNEYYEVMVDVLFQMNGTLDKYVGDELMALFGAPVPMENASLSAVECALEMQHALGEFNRTRVAEQQEPILIGIGINTGMVVTGAIGSSRTLQYTAIGDAVNTASRICALAHPGEVIITESTMMQVKDRVEVVALPPVKVKGKNVALQLYRVLGLRPENTETPQEQTHPASRSV